MKVTSQHNIFRTLSNTPFLPPLPSAATFTLMPLITPFSLLFFRQV